MADDHISLAVGSDGTVYAAVKTSYDDWSSPKIALLVRRPTGQWDDLYAVDNSGTRPIVVLNEAADVLTVIYAERESGGDVKYRDTTLPDIAFAGRWTLIQGDYLTDVSSVKGNITDSLVVIATSKSPSGATTGVVSVRLDAP